MNSLEKKYLMEHINSLIDEKVSNLEEIIMRIILELNIMVHMIL